MGRHKLLEGSNCCEDFEWEDLCNILTAYMNKKNPSGLWVAKVDNFGWDNRCGTKTFQAENGREFLLEILPNTKCSFQIYHYGKKGFAINNAHHDKPCGGEWYYVEQAKGTE